MGRAGAAVRQRARHGRIQWMRSEARLLATFLAVYALVAIGVFLLQSPGVRPYLAGGLLVGGAWLLSWLLSLDGFDRVRLGAEAERWTSSELRRKRRSGWRVVDSIPFEGFDVDHVLVGPGGVYAVETKFTTVSWHQMADRLVVPFGDPLGQAAYGARKVRLLLKSRNLDVPVTPVLLAWGKGARNLEVGSIDGVIVLPGGGLRDWISTTACANPISGDQVQEIKRALDGFFKEREEYERTHTR
jgi:hypothetical protein